MKHIRGLVVPAQEVILKAELIRGPMIILLIIPFLLTFSAGKTRLAVLTGLMLFSIFITSRVQARSSARIRTYSIIQKSAR